MDAADLDAGQRFQLGDDRPQGVAVEGIAMQRFGVQHKLAAFGLFSTAFVSISGPITAPGSNPSATFIALQSGRGAVRGHRLDRTALEDAVSGAIARRGSRVPG